MHSPSIARSTESTVSISVPAPNILTLPLELQIKIFEHLSFYSQIHISRTCKLFEDILLHNNSLRTTRYQPGNEDVDDGYRYHKLIHIRNGGFKGLFVTTKGATVQRYTFAQGYQGHLTGGCDEGVFDKSDDDSSDSELGEEAEGDIIIIQNTYRLWRFRVTDISNGKLLDEPFLVSISRSPVSMKVAIKVRLNRVTRTGRPSSDWATEIELGGNLTVRSLIEFIIGEAQSHMFSDTRTENNISLCRMETGWEILLFQSEIRDERRFMWCPDSGPDDFERSFTVWRNEKHKIRYENQQKRLENK
ncbi:hypothetical protein TWF694_003603 [Orbilia ellipsospora]|uniref:F-box domain-containing protein n=1 Tax=Orbilia ellipsospora TaxID=2528407 RepID=A0AAV9WZU5_9PEZI